MPVWLRETNIDSHFNPIIGVGSCLKLGLIQFQNPVYTGWSDNRPVSIDGHVDAVGTKNSKKNGCGVDVFPRTNNADPMGDRTRMQTSNSKKNGCDVDVFPCANNADPMGDCTRMQTSNNKKTSNQIVRIFHLV